MTIRRWECPKDSELAGWWKGPEGRLVLHCGLCDTPMVQVEYVPAEQLAGAVEALRKIAEMPHNAETDSRVVAAERGRIAREALDHPGGQSQ